VSTYKVVIVGAGPAGYFAAQALQNLETPELQFSIDMIERLPTPWGLVRSGVAPDHPKIKSVSKVFEKIARTEKFRLFANVELGSDVTIGQLQEKYDAVVIATGSTIGKTLGIPGEDLLGSLSAADFVPWYNGHPDFANFSVPLDCETAIVIGAGNVAMDVGRILALEPSELDPTDTADHALEVFKESKIRKVYVSARRGAEHAAFTSPELRDLPKLEHTNVIMSKSDIDGAIARAGDAPEKDVKSNLDAMLLISDLEDKGHARTIEFLFQHRPVAINGLDRVESVTYSTPDGEITIPCGLVITAIGYQAAGIDGIPYEKGKVVNNEGYVKENLYVVGWAKRGPSGVIGTNKSDAAAVVEKLVSQLASPKNVGDVTDLLAGKKYIDQSAWEKLNAHELAEGEKVGKPRRKVVERVQACEIAGI
jgi:ferredoxin--NADP+ reductase